MGGKGNAGVANYVQRIRGSIGYVEYASALQNHMSYVLLQNKDGNFVAPKAEAFQAAASQGCALRPIGIRGTAELFGVHRRTSASWARIRMGEPILPSARGNGDLTELRESLRGAIAKLCG